MKKKQIAVISLVFVLGLALVPSSMGMMGAITDFESVFVDILGSNRLADEIEDLDVENMLESSSLTSNDISSEKITLQKTKILEEETRTYIRDPTGKTAGYLLEDYSKDIFELRGSRGQTSRHFYNKATSKYTYQSDNLVQKEGVYEETNWVTAEEYPHRFLLRQRNGEIHFFETALEITTYLHQIDRTTIWAVGFESFSGIMGFYLNFQDSVNGHAQYLYWPRLSSGTISAYNMPLYAIYPHLYAKTNGDWFDHILNDRALYSGTDQNPRNTLEFYNSDGEFGVFFSCSEVTIQGTTWNFQHGFKYRLEDQKYHMITEFDCVDHDFEDIGLAYEITTSPQSVNTPYSPAKFVLHNAEEEVVVSAEEAWDVGQYLEDFYSEVQIISENNVSFSFTFEDMELAGFTEKYLDLHDQQMPDESVHRVLCAGMYGLGDYSAGTRIQIDPTIWYSTDNYDLYCQSLTWKITHPYMYVGDKYYTYYSCFIAFDTDITDIISDTSSVALQLYCEVSTFEGSSEGANVKVYNIGGNCDSYTAKENSQSYSLKTYHSQSLVYVGGIGSGGYKTANTAKMETLTDSWAEDRNNNEDWISFSFTPYGPEQNDYYKFTDSQGSNDPKLSFDYTVSPNQLREISGYVKEGAFGIQGAHVEIFYGSTKKNGSTTASSGYYSMIVNHSDATYNLYAWHEDYVTQSREIIPDDDKTENFNLTPESVPSISRPYWSEDPTACSDPDGGWTSDTQAYTEGTDYARGITSNKRIYYTDYNWTKISSEVLIQGVYVYVHWKPVLDDKIKVDLFWPNSGYDSKFRTASDWNLVAVDFTDSTEWTASKIKSTDFKVGIQKITNTATNSPDRILVDWVGVLVECSALDITSVSVSNNPEKGDDVTFSITIENEGVSAASDVETKIWIKGDTYTWSGDICNFQNWDGYLGAGATETHYVTFTKFFSYDVKHFAWNAGDYIIDRVDARCDEGATDSYTNDEPFSVGNTSSGPSLIFTVVYYDTEFENINYVSSVSSFFEGAVSQHMRVHDDEDDPVDIYDDGLEDLMDVSYDCLYRSGWNPSASYNMSEMMNDLRDNYAKDDLGLSESWNQIGTGGYLTHEDNHGFDLLVGLSGTGTGPKGGLGIRNGNQIQVNANGAMGLVRAQLITVHELSHNFGAPDHPFLEIYCVMSDGQLHNYYISDWWFVHWYWDVWLMTMSFRG